MIDLFRAEWQKVAGNRWVAGCLIWIFPLMAVAFILVAVVVLSLSDTARSSFQGDETLRWTEYTISVWDVPTNPFGRLILLGFTAVIFGGEYQWQTWKNILPHNRRVSLLLIKFVTLGAFVVIAFGLMSIIWGIGWGLLALVADTRYGPALTGAVLSDFAQDYALQAWLAFTATVIAAGYAALAALFTRSILGGVLVGFGLTLLESLFTVVLSLAGWLFDAPRLIYVGRYLPTYNLANVASWAKDNLPLAPEFHISKHGTYVFSDSLEFSLIVLVSWMLSLFALNALLFTRQDITA